MGVDNYLSVISILGCEFCEIIAATGIGSSLTLFLRSQLGYTIETATIWTAVCTALSAVFALFGGYLSDVILGRKRTILFGCFIYFVALFTVSILTYLFELTDDLPLKSIEVLFWLSLYTMSVGGGAIKANVGVFGADQLKQIEDESYAAYTYPMEIDNLVSYDVTVATMDTNQQCSPQLIQSYWNWFYFTINTGALISYTLIAYLCQDVSFALGWSIPTVAMFCAIFIFLLRGDKYYEVQHDKSMINKFIWITWYALSNRYRKQEIAHDLTSNTSKYDDEWTEDVNFTFLDIAKMKYNGPYNDDLVDEIKAVYRIFGFLPFMTLYWIVESAMHSLYYSQGCQMDYMLSDTFAFPIAALNDMDIITILILIPVMDRVIYPFYSITMLKKIGFGYFILSMAMIVAGIVEIWRKESSMYGIASTCDDTVYISSLSVLWQIPQYVLVGTSKLFASITSLEFFSGQAPDTMKCIVYALNLMMLGIGYLLAALLVFVVDLWKPMWIPDDLDDGYLEYYFFLIAGIMIVTLIAFIPYANKYEYRPGTDVSSMELTDRNAYQPIATDE